MLLTPSPVLSEERRKRDILAALKQRSHAVFNILFDKREEEKRKRTKIIWAPGLLNTSYPSISYYFLISKTKKKQDHTRNHAAALNIGMATITPS